MKILLIDDSPDALAVARARLVHEGHDLCSADGGVTGLDAALRDEPDLILLDVDMPDMDGFEVCRRLKAEPRTCTIPVIFLSGSCNAEDRIKGLDLGAVDFVTKPFDAFELRARVRAALRTKHLQDLLRNFALMDPLTDLPNRRALDQRLAEEWARMLRHGGRFSVVMADLDHFKQINDLHGHPAGDDVLRQVAKVLTSNCRTSDVPARIGGEEFAVLAPQASQADAVCLADRIRRDLSAQPMQLQGKCATVTASFGVADTRGRTSPEDVIAAADAALYQAKADGRNCVRAADPPESNQSPEPEPEELPGFPAEPH